MCPTGAFTGCASALFCIATEDKFRTNGLHHGLLKNTAGYVTLEQKNYQADAVKYFSKINDTFTY